MIRTTQNLIPCDRPKRRRGALLCASILAVTLGQAGSALAQNTSGHAEGGPLGVGVSAMLSGPFGPTIVYDTGAFHIEGILGFESNGSTDFDLGGRFWYHVNAHSAADFSVGGGLGITSRDPDGDEVDSTTDVHIDVGVQIRAFVVSNVALSAAAGLAVISGDADLVSIRGDLTGTAGVIYYF